ncbi:FAD-dependent hydroxylase [Trichothermofontia sp.]
MSATLTVDPFLNVPRLQGQPPESSQPTQCYDVAIVGAGIVGLTLACALQNRGLRIALIEAEPRSMAIQKGQAYAISLLSSQIFAAIGVWDTIRPQISPFGQIRLSDADYSGVVQFFPQDLGTEVLGYVAEHGVLLSALQTQCRESAGVDWLCPATVCSVDYGETAAVVTLQAAGERRSLRSRLVVAADGARSPLRTAAQIKTYGWQYWQACLVCTVKPEKPHGEIAYERFWPSGPFAILPLPDNRCRIVWTAPRPEAEALLALDDADFLAELRRRYGDQMGNLTVVGDRFLFPVRLMQCQRYTGPRLVLVGDAAHGCHPVGGQGMNLGIRDAAALAEVLQRAHQQGQDLGSPAVLAQYDRWRRRENWVILGFTDFLVRLFSNEWLPLVLTRRLGLWLLRHVPPVKRLALRLMTGLSGRRPILNQEELKQDSSPIATGRGLPHSS